MKIATIAIAALLASATGSFARPSLAQGGPSVVLHAEGAAAHLAGQDKTFQFGWGALGLATAELAPHHAFGVEVGGGVIGLSRSRTEEPRFVPSSSGSAVFGRGGVRVHPFANQGAIGGVWVAAGAGIAETGGAFRPTVDARAGVDATIASLALGPYLGLFQIIDSTGGPRSNDPRALLVGIHASFGLAKKPIHAEAPPPDEAGKAPSKPADEPEQDGAATAFDHCENGSEHPDCLEPEEARVIGDKIALGDRVHFRTDMSVIEMRSWPLLGNVAKILRDHPEYERVRVGGHTDDTGEATWNMKLSLERAKSVKAFLVRLGIAPSRLSIEFYGPTKPRAEGATAEARRQNRRVEFEILETRDAASTGARASLGGSR